MNEKFNVQWLLGSPLSMRISSVMLNSRWRKSLKRLRSSLPLAQTVLYKARRHSISNFVTETQQLPVYMWQQRSFIEAYHQRYIQCLLAWHLFHPYKDCHQASECSRGAKPHSHCRKELYGTFCLAIIFFWQLKWNSQVLQFMVLLYANTVFTCWTS